MRSKQVSALVFTLLAGLLSQSLLIPVLSTSIADQKSYYSPPDPHSGSPPSGYCTFTMNLTHSVPVLVVMVVISRLTALFVYFALQVHIAALCHHHMVVEERHITPHQLLPHHQIRRLVVVDTTTLRLLVVAHQAPL